MLANQLSEVRNALLLVLRRCHAAKATASLSVPKTNITAAIGLKLYHAYLVYDAKNNFYMASNPVVLTLTK